MVGAASVVAALVVAALVVAALIVAASVVVLVLLEGCACVQAGLLYNSIS